MSRVNSLALRAFARSSQSRNIRDAYRLGARERRPATAVLQRITDFRKRRETRFRDFQENARQRGFARRRGHQLVIHRLSLWTDRSDAEIQFLLDTKCADVVRLGSPSHFVAVVRCDKIISAPRKRGLRKWISQSNRDVRKAVCVGRRESRSTKSLEAAFKLRESRIDRRAFSWGRTTISSRHGRGLRRVHSFARQARTGTEQRQK